MTAITDASKSQTLIIAGNYSEYLNWRKNNLSIKSCKYVERIEDIQGVHGFLTNRSVGKQKQGIEAASHLFLYFNP